MLSIKREVLFMEKTNLKDLNKTSGGWRPGERDGYFCLSQEEIATLTNQGFTVHTNDRGVIGPVRDGASHRFAYKVTNANGILASEAEIQNALGGNPNYKR